MACPAVVRGPREIVELRSRVRSTRNGDRTDEEAIHRGTEIDTMREVLKGK
jgi:hypothetical protein